MLRAKFAETHRMEVIFTGGKVQAIDDGSTVASLCENEVIVIDATNGKVLRKFSLDGEQLSTFAVSHDSKILTATSREKARVGVFDFETGDLLRTMKVCSVVSC